MSIPVSPAPTDLPPTDPDGLTPAYLSTLLSTPARPVTVTALTHEPVGTGQMAGSFRLHLTYADNDSGTGSDSGTVTESGTVTALPPTLVAKLATGDPGQREFGSGAFRNEVHFYRDMASTFRVPVPAFHGAHISDSAAEFVLLLEDMAPAVQGDQIAGCTPAQARAIAVAAAGLHGPRWNDETLLSRDGFALPTAEDRELLDSVIGPMADAFRSNFTLSPLESRVVDWMVAGCGDWLVAPVEQMALIHSDLRVDNILFGPQGSGVAPVTVVDWQTITVGHPMRDIAFLLSTSLSVEDRRAHEREIVGAYHAALGRHGVADYSLEEAWDHYVHNLIQTPMIVVLGAGAAQATERGNRMFSAMLARGAQAVADLTPDVLVGSHG